VALIARGSRRLEVCFSKHDGVTPIMLESKRPRAGRISLNMPGATNRWVELSP
jgi:hypothetical protein